MFEKTETLQLFPTFVWRHKLAPDHAARINASTTRALDALQGARPAPRRGELVQTEPDLHRRAEFGDLLAAVNLAVRGVLDFVEVQYDSFAITGCWANIAAPGAPHKMHTHPNNYLSGVYYLKVPKGGESISFTDPRPQTMVISPRVERDNPANAGKMIVNVEEACCWFSRRGSPTRSTPTPAARRASASASTPCSRRSPRPSRSRAGRERSMGRAVSPDL